MELRCQEPRNSRNHRNLEEARGILSWTFKGSMAGCVLKRISPEIRTSELENCQNRPPECEGTGFCLKPPTLCNLLRQKEKTKTAPPHLNSPLSLYTIHNRYLKRPPSLHATHARIAPITTYICIHNKCLFCMF